MLSIIVAYDQNRGIGRDNSMPWHYPEDLKYFRKVTQNHTVAMGKNTFLSIGKPLPKRRNIVFTSIPESLTEFEGIEIESDPLKFLKENEHTEEEIFIIGGKMIYEIALPYVKKCYITHIDKSFEVDTYFPEINLQEYTKIAENSEGDLTFAVYEK